MKYMVSIIIPARNEKFLEKTTKDLLAKAKGEIEIIVILDGYWSENKEIINDSRVHYIHRGKARGLRNAVDSAVKIAKGKYIMKIDAHCMFGEGYDTILAADCAPDWVVVPRRYALDAENWKREKKTPIDYLYIESPKKDNAGDLGGRVWSEMNGNPKFEDKTIDDLMTFQGSCWFMEKEYYHKLELFDEENYGTFKKEPQEISFKCWLSGGRVVRNKKTWYAHLHKGKKYGRGYSVDKKDFAKGDEYNKKWLTNTAWDKQTKDIRWLIEKFNPPGWENFKWSSYENKNKGNKVYQNIEIDGVDIGQNLKKKDSKFWNEGKWKNFIVPLLPSGHNDHTFVEVGCNAGLFLRLAKEKGYQRVFGVDSSRTACKEGVKYRDSLGLDYELLRRTVGGDFDFNEVPMADITVLSTVHYYFDMDAWLKYLDVLPYKTRYCLIVSRALARKEHWRAGAEIEEIKNYFKGWSEVSGISDISSRGDMHPRDLWSLLFRSPALERRNLDELYIKNQKLGTWHQDYKEMSLRKNELAEEIAKNDKIVMEETSFYKKWARRKHIEWSEQKLKDFVQNKIDLMFDVKNNGQKEPILVKMSGQICDGGHRVAILKALGHKSAIVRYV